ncbi:MAG: F0F1 ATP synthase subunit B [Gammaproteobacteria bacterium]|nr:F0F1 ATP synthase subunit B [Gammaproteobacteria bacterium]
MDINITLLGEMITFAVFIWFTMKYIWPPLMKTMEDRRSKIADGLAAAEQGQNELELAQHKSKQILQDAKTQASKIIEQANQRANHIVEESKQQARKEGKRLLELAQGEVEQEYMSAKEKLLQSFSKLAVAGAERILQREVDVASNDVLVKELVDEIQT